MSISYPSQICYDIDLRRLLRITYRGTITELIDFDRLIDKLIYTSSLELFSKDVCLFMSYGLPYLEKSKESDFIDLILVQDDEVNPFSNFDLAIDYFLTNAEIFFHALVAYELLAETDIDDYTNERNFRLSNIYSGLLVFEYEER